MGEGTRVVDYGKDITDLRAVVKALQVQVAMLQKRLEDNGTLYGGAVAYSDKFVKTTYKTNGVEFE